MNNLPQFKSLAIRFAWLRNRAKEIKNWQLLDNITHVEENYIYMLKYFISNGNDYAPERIKILEKFLMDFHVLNERLSREIDIEDSNIYSSKLRFYRMRPDDTIQSLAKKYLDELDRISSDLTIMTSPAYRSRAERLAGDLFYLIFVTYPLPKEDIETITLLILNEAVPDYTKQMLVSALFLGLAFYKDYPRLDLLLTIYEIGSREVAAVALSSFFIIYSLDNSQLKSQYLAAHIERLVNTESWEQDIATVFSEDVRAYITLNSRTGNASMASTLGLDKLNDDVMRRMTEQNIDMTDADAIEKFMSDEGLLDSESFDKIRDIQQRQSEGDDILIDQFAQLKRLPFFNELTNWLMPFHLDHSAIAEIVMSTANADTATSIADMIAAIPMMCDSDKYSLVLSLASIPANMRGNALSQLCLRQEDLAHLSVTDQDDNTLFRLAVNKFFKNVTRLLKFSKFKSDLAINLEPDSSILFLGDGHCDMPQLFDFLCKSNNYNLIKKTFDKLKNIYYHSVNAEHYLKIGKAAYEYGAFEDAIDYLLQALNRDSGLIEAYIYLNDAYLKAKNHSLKEKFFERALKYDESNTRLLIRYYYALYNSHKFDKAIDIAYQLDYLMPDNPKVLRLIAWHLLINGDYSGAQAYYDRISKFADFNAEDYRRLGHLAFLQNEIDKAIDFYAKAVSDKSELECESIFDTNFMKTIQKELKLLDKNNYESYLLTLILIFDSVRIKLGIE